MEIIDLNSLDQGAVYMLYEIFISMRENLEKKEIKEEADKLKLQQIEIQLEAIERWVDIKINEKLHWTKEEILLKYGNDPTVILHFHPSTNSYKKYGKELVANIIFSYEELMQLIENIRNKLPRKSGVLNFNINQDKTIKTIETKEIFEITGRQIL